MQNHLQLYINGQWVDPADGNNQQTIDVINPATEKPCATINAGSTKDVDNAVQAARRPVIYTYSTIIERSMAEPHLTRGLVIGICSNVR